VKPWWALLALVIGCGSVGQSFDELPIYQHMGEDGVTTSVYSWHWETHPPTPLRVTTNPLDNRRSLFAGF
jgi:hypothetical protein